MCLLGLIWQAGSYSRSFPQLELERLFRLAGADQMLPFVRIDHVFDARPIAIGEIEFLHHVLHLAPGTFNVQPGFGHGSYPSRYFL